MVIGVFDVGGSHISYGYIDAASFRFIGEGEDLTKSVQTSEGNPLTVLVGLVERAKALYGDALCGLSLAVPSPFDHILGVSQMQHKLIPLYGLNLRQIFSESSALSEPDIVFMNDADAFLLGALFASNLSTGRSVGITLGTGVGSSFANNTEILFDGHGVPPDGEIWNLPYGDGSVEDTVSTRRLEGDYLRRTGLARSVKSIAEAANHGEFDAREVFISFGRELAEVLERICTPFDPQRILLGGGISSAGPLFLPTLYENRWCADRVSIVTRREAAPLLGTAVGWARSRSGGMTTMAPPERTNPRLTVHR